MEQQSSVSYLLQSGAISRRGKLDFAACLYFPKQVSGGNTFLQAEMRRFRLANGRGRTQNQLTITSNPNAV